MHSCCDSHKSSQQSSSSSHVYGHARERPKSPEKLKRSRYYRRKSSRDRSRSRDAKRDNYRRSASNRYHRRSSSRSRSNSPYQSVRQNGSRRYKSSHEYRLPTRNVSPDLKLITHDACYFLLKSNNFDNLLLAKAESVWSTPPHNEVRINNAFKVCEYGTLFILVFCQA